MVWAALGEKYVPTSQPRTGPFPEVVPLGGGAVPGEGGATGPAAV